MGRGDRIPAELFKILKDDAVKVLHSTCQQIWKTQQWPQDWKRSVFIPIPKKGNAKGRWNYHIIALISHARLQQYMNKELPDVQAEFRKGRRIRDQIANIHWIIEKAREFQKNIYFCSLTMLKLLAVCSESPSVVSDSLRPQGLYNPWNSPARILEVGSLSFLQAIFPTQGSNPGLPHCRRILYQLSH